MRWLALPVALVILAGLAYGLWPRGAMPASGGFDATALAAALAELSSEPGPAAVAASAPVSFPADHGAHPEARAELWELSAVLQDAGKRPVAVRLTVARLGLSDRAEPRASAMAADALFAGELVVTAGGDIKAGALREQRVSRAALGLAGAGADQAGVERVWIEQWTLAREAGGSVVLRAAAGGVELRLGFSPLKPPLVLDQQAFASPTSEDGAASLRLYSQSRLAVSGSLRLEGVEQPLQGLGWLDHGWGDLSETLSGGRGQLVANRFQLQLDDGSELACLHLRRRGGGGTPIPSCVLIGVDGEQVVLQRRDLTLAPTDAKSVAVGGTSYPLGWRLMIPARELELEIKPLFASKGSGPASTVLMQGNQTWRGAVEVKGRRGADALDGHGRMDLNGYAEGGIVGTGFGI
ncbi:hypothetical protein CKO42_07485 [Lamprobacter modestohalophilus]|uniref:AttH domain-containing protein n=1 Tax=Lamprobacter modestohalophilus TaxID=1064514 RepID=A0A9X1B3C7_9GAMM|nr:lipocalin-like domain-containing protein [Lamprobacter modestohalophilus]MBK1618285.1 hypothetical protein [Lamprobacter modestohalophilus]